MDIDIFQIPAILRKRWLVIATTTMLAVAGGGAWAVLHKPSFTASVDVLVDQQGIKSDNGEISIWGASQAQPEAIVDSQIFVMQSRDILQAVVKKMALTKDPVFNNVARNGDTGTAAENAAIAALAKAVTVSRNGQSFILRVTVKNGNAQRAADIANEIAKAYLANVTGARSQAIDKAAGAFEVQAKELRERVFKAEAELERFKARNGLVSTGQQGLLIDQQVEGINRQLIAARGEVESKKTIYEQAAALTQAAIEAGNIPEAMQSGMLGTLRQRLSDLKSRETELATALGSNHPQMRAVRGQIAAINQSITQEVTRLRASMKSAWQRAESNYKAINGQLESLKSRSLDSSEAGIGAKQLQAEVDALRALYKTFLTRAEQFGPGDSSDTNYSRVISPAVPGSASSLMLKLLVLTAAGMFGIAFGAALAVLMEFLTPGGLLSQGGRRRHDDEADEDIDDHRPSHDAPVSNLPVIAEIPMRKPARMGLVRRETEGLKADARIALIQAAETLIRGRRHDKTQTVLVLSAEEDGSSASLVGDLAAALHGLGEDVLWSDGQAATGTPSNRPAQDLGDIARLMKFERLSGSQTPARAGAAAPTWRNYRGRSASAGFMLIDGTGPQARNHLPGLLHAADTILIVARDRSDWRKLDRLAHALKPWQDAMLGTIVLADAA